MYSISYSQPGLIAFKGQVGEIIHGLGYFRDVKVSPDGQYMATGGTLGVFLWDLESGLTQPVTYLAHTEVRELMWEETGDCILMRTASNSSGLLQDVRKGLPFGTAFNPNDFVLDGTHQFFNWKPYREDLLISPRGNKHITIEEDNAVIWDSATQSRLHEIPGTYEEGYVSFMNHGESIVTVTGKHAEVWDANTFELLRTVRYVPEGRHHFGFIPIQFTKQNPYIAVVWQEPDLFLHIQVTNINTGVAKFIHSYTDGSVFAFSNDRKKAFVVQERKTYIADLETWEYGIELENPEGHSGHDTRAHSSAVFSPDDSIVAFCPSEIRPLTVYIYNVNTGKIIKTFETDKWVSPRESIILQFSPDGQALVVAQNYKTEIFDYQSGEILRTFEYPYSFFDFGDVTAINAEFTEMTFAVDDRIERWDVINQSLLCTLEGVFVRSSGAILSPNGLAYARFARSREQFHFNLSECEHLRAPQEFEESPLYMNKYIFTDDEEWMLGFDGQEGIWYHVPSNRIAQTFNSPSFGRIASITLSADVTKFYIGRYDGVIVEMNLPALSNVGSWQEY